MKRFWKKTEGFTLVELIVVIAVLGILAGVGTVGYSGYIKKANMAADQQLVSQVKNALQLKYYADPVNTEADYVVLTTSGAKVGGDVATQAMEAAFGQGWEDMATLKYNGWIDNVAGTIQNADIADSSFVQHSTPGELMQTVSNLSNQLTAMAATAGQDPLVTLEALGGTGFGLTAEQAAAIKQDVKNNYGLEYVAGGNNDQYAQVLSNVLVKYVMDDLGTVGTGDKSEANAGLSTLTVAYATVYGWALTDPENGAEILKNADEVINNPSSSSTQIVNAVVGALGSAGRNDSFIAYTSGQGPTDANAVYGIMGAASKVTNGADMTQAGLYTSSEFAGKVDNYFGAVTAVDGMDEAQLAELEAVNEGDIVVFLTATGGVLAEYSN